MGKSKEADSAEDYSRSIDIISLALRRNGYSIDKEVKTFEGKVIDIVARNLGTNDVLGVEVKWVGDNVNADSILERWRLWDASQLSAAIPVYLAIFTAQDHIFLDDELKVKLRYKKGDLFFDSVKSFREIEAELLSSATGGPTVKTSKSPRRKRL